MDNAQKILENIKTTKTLLDKSPITSGNQYQVRISYNGKKCYMVYNDNFYNNSTKEDFIFCLIRDAQAFINSNNNIYNFCRDFGYDNLEQGSKAFYECKSQYIEYNKLFNNAEQKELEDYFSNY